MPEGATVNAGDVTKRVGVEAVLLNCNFEASHRRSLVLGEQLGQNCCGGTYRANNFPPWLVEQFSPRT
jgi:hypothetical protein